MEPGNLTLYATHAAFQSLSAFLLKARETTKNENAVESDDDDDDIPNQVPFVVPGANCKTS
jgi:hypothetical protein